MNKRDTEGRLLVALIIMVGVSLALLWLARHLDIEREAQRIEYKQTGALGDYVPLDELVLTQELLDQWQQEREPIVYETPWSNIEPCYLHETPPERIRCLRDDEIKERGL